jgi:hypothetical protein
MFDIVDFMQNALREEFGNDDALPVSLTMDAMMDEFMSDDNNTAEILSTLGGLPDEMQGNFFDELRSAGPDISAEEYAILNAILGAPQDDPMLMSDDMELLRYLPQFSEEELHELYRQTDRRLQSDMPEDEGAMMSEDYEIEDDGLDVDQPGDYED